MRNKENRNTLLFKPRDVSHQLRGLRRGKGRGWLVQDQQTQALHRDRTTYFDHLSLGNGKSAKLGTRFNVVPREESIECALNVCLRPFAPSKAFGDGEVLLDAEILENRQVRAE
jgi:hypothetical protein